MLDDYLLPSGGVDVGESYENTLIKELNEETGAVNNVIKELDKKLTVSRY